MTTIFPQDPQFLKILQNIIISILSTRKSILCFCSQKSVFTSDSQWQIFLFEIFSFQTLSSRFSHLRAISKLQSPNSCHSKKPSWYFPLTIWHNFSFSSDHAFIWPTFSATLVFSMFPSWPRTGLLKLPYLMTSWALLQRLAGFLFSYFILWQVMFEQNMNDF